MVVYLFISLKELKTIQNIITLIRILLMPVLWVMGFLHLRFTFGLIYTFGGITDVLDGYLARKLNQTSDIGVRLDSFADVLMNSSLVFLWVFIPEFIRQHVIIIIITLGVTLVSYIVGLIKFHKIV